MKRKLQNILNWALSLALLACTSAAQAQDSLQAVAPYQTGKATYYSPKMHGRRMASGKTYRKEGFTCAHRSLPFGTLLKVVNTQNGKATVVEVADRGPFRKGVVVDISNAAAAALEMLRAGIVPVALYLVPDSVQSDNKVAEDEKRQEQ